MLTLRKMMAFPLFRFATRLNSQNLYMKLVSGSTLKRKLIFTRLNSVRKVTYIANS